MKPRLSIVIPVFNNWNYTKSCLKDLSQLPDDIEVIVVNNGSTDETVDFVNRFQHLIHSDFNFLPQNLKLINLDSNKGFAVACNEGYNQSRSDNVMFLNNDIRVQKNHTNWVDQIIENIHYNTIVGPTFGCLDKNFKFLKEENSELNEGYVYLSGWNISAHKDVWNELIVNNDCGPFSTEFFAYFEDTDLSMRAYQKGIKLKLIENVPVFHFGRTTGRTLNMSEIFLASKQKFLNKWVGKIEMFYKK